MTNLTTEQTKEARLIQQLNLAENYEEFEKIAGISGVSPEAYYAELAWNAAFAAGYQKAWAQASKLNRPG